MFVSVFASVFVYVVESSEDDSAECVGWCLIGRLCTALTGRGNLSFFAGHLSAKCDHAAPCDEAEDVDDFGRQPAFRIKSEVRERNI